MVSFKEGQLKEYFSATVRAIIIEKAKYGSVINFAAKYNNICL